MPLAIAFAQYISCTGDKSGGDACGCCKSCSQYSKLSHPDLHMIYPIIKKKDGSGDSDTYLKEWRELFARTSYFSLQQWLDELGGEKQGAISKDDAVAIHRKLSMKPLEAEYQVLIMWRPELMNETASNRILKILEEPPHNTIFILVSEQSSDILPTILSRTQIVKIPPIDTEAMTGAIKSAYGLADEQAQRVAHIADGNYIKATYTINNSEESQRNLDFFSRIMRCCYARKVKEMVAMSDEMQKMPRESMKSALTYSLRMIRENFIMNLNCEQLNYMTPNEEKFSQKFAPFVHLNNAIQMTDVFNEALAHVEQNGNVRIIMMDLLIKTAALLKKPRP